MSDDLIKDANEGRGTPGKKPRDLLYPNTDHDKIVATEALVEVMRQHQVQQGIVMNRIAEEMMKLAITIEEKLDKFENIFNEHCKQEIKDCGGCRVSIDRAISEAEGRANQNLALAMGRIEALLEKQDAKIVPRWMLASIGSLVIVIFITVFGLIQYNRDYIHQHKAEAKQVEEFIKQHNIVIPNAQGFNGQNIYSYGITDEKNEEVE
jgi:hypothetical protein